MSGFIVKANLIENKELVVELYGIDVFNRCMVAGENETFLGILIEMGRI